MSSNESFSDAFVTNRIFIQSGNSGTPWKAGNGFEVRPIKASFCVSGPVHKSEPVSILRGRAYFQRRKALNWRPTWEHTEAVFQSRGKGIVGDCNGGNMGEKCLAGQGAGMRKYVTVGRLDPRVTVPCVGLS